MNKTEQLKKRLKNKLTKEWQSTNALAEYLGQGNSVYRILQEFADEGFAEKQKIGRITYWRKIKK